MNKTTAIKVIEALESIFVNYGIPTQLVSDNGPPFTSKEFVGFCEQLGIQCTKSPAYHPQSNGLAERFVQTVKSSL